MYPVAACISGAPYWTWGDLILSVYSPLGVPLTFPVCLHRSLTAWISSSAWSPLHQFRRLSKPASGLSASYGGLSSGLTGHIAFGTNQHMCYGRLSGLILELFGFVCICVLIHCLGFKFPKARALGSFCLYSAFDLDQDNKQVLKNKIWLIFSTQNAGWKCTDFYICINMYCQWSFLYWK